MSLSSFGISESFIYEQLKLRFGSFLDVFTGLQPNPVTTMQHYCKLHGIKNITRMMIMSSDINNSIKYLSDNIDNSVEVSVYGNLQSETDIDYLNKNYSKIDFHNTKEELSEHINLIYSKEFDFPFVWHEPLHIRKDDGKDYFGFEDEEDSSLGHRLRPRLYKIESNEQLENILKTFKDTEV